MVYTVKDYCRVCESDIINLDMSTLGEQRLETRFRLSAVAPCVFSSFRFQSDVCFHQQNPIGNE